jgi:hypothetical protein
VNDPEREAAATLTVEGREAGVCPGNHVANVGLPSTWCPQCRVWVYWQPEERRYVIVRSGFDPAR